ncbi:S9 family peptidase [Flavobacterium sp. CBA20B-1]|uniref:S9 family peptidase n=1 Tax=unclassified Flavobacterium TaxID=196869 RepID=UPI002224FCA8|nr:MULTISPECIES: S9 family peptidase [unclassified Flavobacterium]WCM43116.1 S9 family peptidase [Flavobacterium sp. CBA20B-1]
MKKILLPLTLIAAPITTIQAQQQIEVAQIWNGTFRTNQLNALNTLHTKNQYSVLDYNRNTGTFTIDAFDFTTLEKVQTLFSTADFPEINQISDYSINITDDKILIATDYTPIYRHSFTSVYYLFDIASKSLVKVSDNAIQEPLLNKNGSKIAYAFENNLYVFDVATKKTTQITKDGEKNTIINGITDWVYEEEFAFVRAFDWNADGTKLAYIRFDESEVPVFSMDVYGESLYPQQQVFKYPKAGENNSKVSLHLYDVSKASTQNVTLNAETAYYIPRIKFTNNTNVLSVQTLNRHQNQLNLLFVDANSGKTSTILTEKDKAYVDITDNLTFLNDNSFIWTSEKDGYNHIYHYNNDGSLKKQVTNGNWEVTNYYGYNKSNETIYYQSVENGSTKRDVYSIQLNGSGKKQLSSQSGTNSATFSPDFKYFINNHSSSTKAPSYTLVDASTGKNVKEILNNAALEDKLKKFDLPKKEFTTFKNEVGNDLNGYMIKPKNFDTKKKYPVLLYQYSGPGSQEVADSWHDLNDYWHMMLAQKGYIVVCVDGRGTGFKGANFKKVTQKELGKFEVEDQIFVAKQLAKESFVDANRIGIWGWSFGGFMSSNALFQANDVFKTAIAVAPVTSWRFYDSVYTERFMTTPQENASGYDNNSPITHADKLKGNFLLIHGTADDNVHVQNSMLLINKLVALNKNFDWLIYPDKNHGIYGGKTREQLYTKMTDYILEKL